MRSVGKATIAFGMVSIPVKLYNSADTSQDISFNLLHGKCNSKLKQQYICSKEGTVISRDEMVKGYQYSKDQYVIFTKDEIKSLEEESTKIIEIKEFVPLEVVDPLYFSKTYYLSPDGAAGDKPYNLLSKAILEANKGAIAQYSVRGKQYLIMIRHYKGGLALTELRYAKEVRDFSKIETGHFKPNEQEVNLALQLIEHISVDSFKPEQYKDNVKERLQQAVDEKMNSGKIQFVSLNKNEKPIVDLLEALKISISQQEKVTP